VRQALTCDEDGTEEVSVEDATDGEDEIPEAMTLPPIGTEQKLPSLYKLLNSISHSIWVLISCSEKWHYKWYIRFAQLQNMLFTPLQLIDTQREATCNITY
jgi:hypothetical protein